MLPPPTHQFDERDLFAVSHAHHPSHDAGARTYSPTSGRVTHLPTESTSSMSPFPRVIGTRRGGSIGRYSVWVMAASMRTVCTRRRERHRA